MSGVSGRVPHGGTVSRAGEAANLVPLLRLRLEGVQRILVVLLVGGGHLQRLRVRLQLARLDDGWWRVGCES